MDADTRARLQRHLERDVPLDEALAYLSTPIDDEERRGVLELVDWFLRRYPDPIDRLRYVDRTYRAWTRSQQK